MIKVLIVDDSALVRKLFGQIFAADMEFEVEFARNGVEALDKLASFQPDVITLDIEMPQMDGLQCLDRIMIERPSPVVMVSSISAEGAEATLEALRLGAVDFVAKPDGAVSLKMHVFAPHLLEKVRVAARVKLKASTRLRERIRHRLAKTPLPTLVPSTRSVRATGAGLVLVGCSTGGPPALEALLSPLPADFPWPIVVAQHIPAAFTGPLASRLDGLCAIAVREVQRTVVLEPGRAYIGQGDADVIISRRAGETVAVSCPSQAGYPWHPSTERLVCSAMEHFAPTALIGVLMTGMGDDGAQALARLHALGGRTIAESEETAVVWGMPGVLAKMGGADWVLPLPKIANQLMKLVPGNASSASSF